MPKPIQEIAARIGIRPDALIMYGADKAKVITDRVTLSPEKKGKLVMVTAMTPTPAGEGKTTTAIGLADALNLKGRTAVVAIREPSLGPVFGMKGGATGGGAARVVPSDEINLHFTGDLHAVTSAHNLLSAMVDNRLHFDGVCGPIDCRLVTWKRVMDMDDRALRNIVIGIGEPMRGIVRESGFDITAASEVMAVFCLARDPADLKERLGRILVGYSPQNKPVFARDIKANGAMAALLKDALRPNLVQTLEGTPAFVHGGPFANIAHGTSSLIATRLALGLADFVVTETGFASDLGAEKFYDIVLRSGEIPPPAAVVIVATLRALKYHGGVKIEDLGKENVPAVEKGFANLQKHIENVRMFGSPLVVTLNKFPTDTDAEAATLRDLCAREKAAFALSDVYARGGAGGTELAEVLLKMVAEPPQQAFSFLYALDIPLKAKIETVAKKIYGAGSIAMEGKIRKKIEKMEADGFGGLPICIAKTQYSLSADPQMLGRPRDFTLVVTNATVSSGAGFVVVHSGDIMTMPGLPKAPAAEHIDIDEKGNTTGIT